MILTIAIPAYNMEKVLANNLSTYVDKRMFGKVEILILNNDSSDGTGQIAESFAKEFPQLFISVLKENHGYGSSVNWAIKNASGKYFRVIDADDYVDTNALIEFVHELEKYDVDVVETPYCRVFGDKKSKDVVSLPTRFACGKIYSMSDVDWEQFLPCLHSTTYRTEILQKYQILLQEDLFFVDEEFVTLPFAYVQNVLWLPMPVYQYCIGNPEQSTSDKNRAKYYPHREQIIFRLIEEMRKCPSDKRERYIRCRVSNAVKDHLTTLFIYWPNRGEGRRLAVDFLKRVQSKDMSLAKEAMKKYCVLKIVNYIHMPICLYKQAKKLVLRLF